MRVGADVLELIRTTASVRGYAVTTKLLRRVSSATHGRKLLNAREKVECLIAGFEEHERALREAGWAPRK